jgi:lipid A 4'-phosphatase
MGRRFSLDLVIPVALLLLLSIPLLLTDLDVELERRFYHEGPGWYLAEKQPWLFLYEHGTLPGLLIGAGALIVLMGSIWKQSFRPHRAASLFLVLTLAIGPGLIVNTILKEHWGRPRPRDLILFGGEREHWKVWERKPVSGGGASLPSGHASVAFYLFTPFFILRRRRWGWALFFLALGLAYGVFMGIARMVQGGHFASDVLWAGGIVYLTGYFLSRLLLRGER